MREMLNEFTGKGGDYVSQQGTTSTSRTPFPSHRSPPKLLGLNTWINIILKLYQKCAKGVLGSCPTPSPNVVTHLGYRGNVSSTPDLSAHVNVYNGWRVWGGEWKQEYQLQGPLITLVYPSIKSSSLYHTVSSVSSVFSNSPYHIFSMIGLKYAVY